MSLDTATDGDAEQRLRSLAALTYTNADQQPRLAATVLRRAKRNRMRLTVIRTSLAGAVVVGSVAVAVLVGGGPRGSGGIAQAATPALLSYQVIAASRDADLRTYASRVSKLPEDPKYLDDNHRVVTHSWSLFTRVNGEQVASAVVPQRRDLTWRGDGSGTLSVVTESPDFPSPEYRQAWEASGRPAKESISITDEEFAPGGYEPQFPASLPIDQTELVAILKSGHPIDDIGTAELFVAIADLYREQTPAPQVRAELLRLIDLAVDVDDLGPVIDRQGRAGRGVAVTSNYSGLATRYILAFDRNDGTLLSFEQVLIGNTGKLEVASPAVISYELYDHQINH